MSGSKNIVPALFAVLAVAAVVVGAMYLWPSGEAAPSDNKVYSLNDPSEGMQSNYASKVQVHEMRALSLGDTTPFNLTEYKMPNGKKLLALNVTLTNKFNSTEAVSSFILITDDYTTHYRALLHPDSVPQTIGNKSSATFWIAFEVDEDAGVGSLEYAKPSYELFVKL